MLGRSILRLTNNVLPRLNISERDRLLAAGLLSFVVAFFLFSRANFRANQTLMILGVFVAGAVVFSISPLIRGTELQKLCAVLFLLPPLAYTIILISVLVSGRLE